MAIVLVQTSPSLAVTTGISKVSTPAFNTNPTPEANPKMFSATTLTTLAAFIAGSTMASPLVPRNTLPPSHPYILAVTSVSSHKFLNATLSAPHSGAGEEAFVPAAIASTLGFNLTVAEFPPGYTAPGHITYYAPGNGQAHYINNTLSARQNASSNVQALFFGPGQPENPPTFTFSQDGNRLFWLEDDVATSYFWVCPVTNLGDQFWTLSYVAEGATPDNADCDAVTVQIFNDDA